MHEFCLVCLIFSVQLDVALTQRWWYLPVPSYVQRPSWNNGQYNVAGWAQSPTTEPPLGPNDRMNTTDVPEEIEARPDQTRAQRRRMLKRMNPGATSQQIEAQLLRDDKARARMAATQSEPVVIQPEPVTAPTVPPPVTPKPKPKPKPKTKQTKQKQTKIVATVQMRPTAKPGKIGLNVPGNQPRKARPQNRKRGFKTARRWRPRRTTTTTTEPPPPTTFPPTYPTTQYFPTTYPTAHPYNEPIVTNPPRRRGPPRRQQPPRQLPRRQRQRQRPRPRLVGSEIGHILSIFG